MYKKIRLFLMMIIFSINVQAGEVPASIVISTFLGTTATAAVIRSKFYDTLKKEHNFKSDLIMQNEGDKLLFFKKEIELSNIVGGIAIISTIVSIPMFLSSSVYFFTDDVAGGIHFAKVGIGLLGLGGVAVFPQDWLLDCAINETNAYLNRVLPQPAPNDELVEDELV